MSRLMPETAGSPAKDFASSTSRMAPPVIVRSTRHRRSQPGEVRGEPVDVVAVVLDGKEPLLHLAPRGEEHAAIVLHQPVQLTVSGIDLQEVAELAHRAAPEGDAPLGPYRHHVPLEA